MKFLQSIIDLLQKQAGWVVYTGGNDTGFYNMISRIVTLYQLLRDLTKSYEYYCAHNKPEEEWDEYDHMIYPVWKRLKEFLEDENGR